MKLMSHRRKQMSTEGLMKLLLPILLCLSLQAATYQVGQNATGNGSGSDTADLMSVATWNSGQAAGSVAVLNGAFTTEVDISAASQQILFAAGGSIAPAAARQMNTAGWPNIVIDGKGAGWIGCTANGSALANQVDVSGIVITGSSNVTIRNLVFSNEYVHTSLSDTTINPGSTGAIYANGQYGTLTVTNCSFYNACWCLNLQSSATNIIWGNRFTNYDHGIAFGGSGGYFTTDVASNVFSTTSNWDTTAGGYHHDGIHYYAAFKVTGFTNRANLFCDNWGADNTTYVFNDTQAASNFFTFDCIGVQAAGNYLNDGMMVLTGVNCSAWNNTFIGSGVANSVGVYFGGSGSSLSNNVFSGLTTFVDNQTGTMTGSDYNLFSNPASGGNSPYVDNGTNYASLAAWQSATGQDSHSATPAVTFGGNYAVIGSTITGSPQTAFSADYYSTPFSSWGPGAVQLALGGITITPGGNISIVPAGPGTNSIQVIP